jgi:hypothetical protein
LAKHKNNESVGKIFGFKNIFKTYATSKPHPASMLYKPQNKRFANIQI